MPRRTRDGSSPGRLSAAPGGKHKAHGLLFLALTDERGDLVWISAAKPGRSSEITIARHNKFTIRLREAGLVALADLGLVALADLGLVALADLGLVGLDDDPDGPVIVTGCRASRGHPPTATQKEANRLVSRERVGNEHGFADLKNWRIPTKVRMNPRHATTLLRALLGLTNADVRR